MIATMRPSDIKLLSSLLKLNAYEAIGKLDKYVCIFTTSTEINILLANKKLEIC